MIDGINNDKVGQIVDYCMNNHDKVDGPAFQPVSFTGRDEEISDEQKKAQRYTTSHLVHDLRKPFDMLARGLVGAMGGSGEGKVTRLELFSAGVLDLEDDVRELIRAAA